MQLSTDKKDALSTDKAANPINLYGLQNWHLISLSQPIILPEQK